MGRKLNNKTKPDYPVLNPGEFVRLDRPECGENVAIAVKGQAYRPLLREQFIYSRPINKPSRSRHAPHVGKKELGRAAVVVAIGNLSLP